MLALRDLAQRHWGQRVLRLILVGAALSWRLGAAALALALALASVSAFLVSESVDWLFYSTTHRPVAERVWRAVLASVPIDTAVVLHRAALWIWALFGIGVVSKLLAGARISLALRRRPPGAARASTPRT